MGHSSGAKAHTVTRAGAIAREQTMNWRSQERQGDRNVATQRPRGADRDGELETPHSSGSQLLTPPSLKTHSSELEDTRRGRAATIFKWLPHGQKQGNPCTIFYFRHKDNLRDLKVQRPESAIASILTASERSSQLERARISQQGGVEGHRVLSQRPCE